MGAGLLLNELTREEVLALAPRSTVLLPTASTEQHGPHLPLSTDSLLGEAVALRAAELAATRVPVVVAPVLAFGSSHHHLFACALSLRSSTFLGVLNDLADCLVAAGFRRLFVLNAHGGNDECVKLLVKDLVLRHPVAAAACSYWQLSEAAAREVAASELGRFPGHSGGFETAMMMAVAPQLVRTHLMPLERPEPSLLTREVARGLVVQKAGEWKRTGGYTDAPTKATPEAGRSLLEVISQDVAGAIVAFHRAAYDNEG